MISDNWIAFYENEMAWVHKLRKDLSSKYRHISSSN